MIRQFLDFAASLVTRAPRAAEPAIVTSGQYRDLGAMLEATRALPPAPYIRISAAAFNPREGLEIGMNCAGITDARSPAPILGTYGLATCLGVAVFNPATKTGGLAHLAQQEGAPLHLAREGAEALQRLLVAVRSNLTQQLDVRMTAGPVNDQYPFTREVLAILNATPNLRILSSDTGTKRGVKAFGIDTRRWDEGLLKGANSCPLPADDIIPGTPAMAQFREGLQHVVEIADLPPGRPSANGLIDTRSAALRAPAGGRPASNGTTPR